MASTKLHEKVVIGKGKLVICSSKVDDGVKILVTLTGITSLTYKKEKTYQEGVASLERRQEVFTLLDEFLRFQNMLIKTYADLFDQQISPLLNEMFKKLKLG